MTRRLLTGNEAAAWGARLAKVDYIPAFPITPQTEIIETLSRWIARGELSARLVMLESEHSMMTAAGAAAATGVRVFTATSSQGLLYAIEMLYTVAGWRVPLVLVNVSRGVASPITLEPDHNDVLAARDSGVLQIHCASCQEVLDTTLMAFRLAETETIRLPVIVNLDGFYLSFTREPVDIPKDEAVDAFLGPFAPIATHFRGGESVSQGVAVLGGGPYSYFRYQSHLAALEALGAHDAIARQFAERFGREHGLLEQYRTEDASLVFCMIGSFATKAKAAVDRLRSEGVRIGLVRPRVLRPFPEAAIRAALVGRLAVIVVDQNLSMGKGGVLHTEIASTLYGAPGAPPLLSFVAGLGGRDISDEDFAEMASVAEHASKSGSIPAPRLLYTQRELDDLRRLQSVARAQ